MNSRQSSGSARVNRFQALEIALERAPEVQLARKIAAVANPHRVRARAQRAPMSRHSRLWSMACRRTAASVCAETAELVRHLLVGLILKGVRVHRVEEQAARLGERAQLAGIGGLVPGNMQRDAGRRARQLEDDLAVLELLEHVARLAGHRKAREPRPARSTSPRRHGDAERHRAVDEVSTSTPRRASCRPRWS